MKDSGQSDRHRPFLCCEQVGRQRRYYTESSI